MRRLLLVLTALAALTVSSSGYDERYPWLEPAAQRHQATGWLPGKQKQAVPWAKRPTAQVQGRWWYETFTSFRFQHVFVGKASTACLPATVRAQLAAVHARWPITIFSTSRPGSIVAGTRTRANPEGNLSMHDQCRAADFHVDNPGQRSAVLAYLRANRIGGLGTYCGGYQDFHIDDGRVRNWSNGCGPKKLRIKKRRAENGNDVSPGSGAPIRNG